jgi:hypothetical protein
LARFERRGEEDRNESIRQKRYIERDVDMALITPAGSRDVMVHVAEDWFRGLQKSVREGRMPQSWLDRYQDQYRRWKEGEELPVDGTPIKGWGIISPAQQKNLIGINVLTVEDLAKLNDEGVRRIGMGGVELKNKAIAWLKTLDDKGGLAMENAVLKTENESLKARVDALAKKLEEFMEVGAKSPVPDAQVVRASDIPDDEPVPKRPQPKPSVKKGK